MAAINKVFLMGNLGRDPDLRTTNSGQHVCEFSLATSETWQDRSGERQERTEWHRIIVWGRQGENAAKYLKKGRAAFVEGRIQYRDWTDKDGNKRTTTEIVANNVQFLGGAGDDRRGGRSDDGPPPPDDSNYRNDNETDESSPSSGTFSDDDIPF